MWLPFIDSFSGNTKILTPAPSWLVWWFCKWGIYHIVFSYYHAHDVCPHIHHMPWNDTRQRLGVHKWQWMNEWFDGCFNFVLVLNIDYGLGGSMAHDTISCRSPPLFKMLSYYFLYVFQSPHLASHVHVSFPNFILLLSSILYTCMSIFMNQISRLYSSCRMLNDKFLNFVCISDMIVLIIIF